MKSKRIIVTAALALAAVGIITACLLTNYHRTPSENAPKLVDITLYEKVDKDSMHYDFTVTKDKTLFVKKVTEENNNENIISDSVTLSDKQYNYLKTLTEHTHGFLETDLWNNEYDPYFRINENGILIPDANNPYKYKLVYYDDINQSIEAVYILENYDYNIHSDNIDAAQFIIQFQKEVSIGEEHATAVLENISNLYGTIFKRYRPSSRRFIKLTRKSSSGRANSQNESDGGRASEKARQYQDRNLIAVHNLTARVIDFDKNKRNDLSVIAQTTSLGNITESFLDFNLSQFKKEINRFKQKIIFNTKTAKGSTPKRICIIRFCRKF